MSSAAKASRPGQGIAHLPCPCGGFAATAGRNKTPLRYADCCQPLHEGRSTARDAEQLMRSRYSGYVLGLESYLLRSYHPRSRPKTLNLADNPTWLGLTIKRAPAADGDHAIVEFIARFRRGGGSAQRLHEISRFERIDGSWFYVDGESLE